MTSQKSDFTSLHHAPPDYGDPELDDLVRETIGRAADKWTMLVLETLQEGDRTRFTRLGELVGGISQKMLTRTLRQMEADGLLTRTVDPVIPPRVEYRLTELGSSLSAAFCGVWVWAEHYREDIAAARLDQGRATFFKNVTDGESSASC